MDIVWKYRHLYQYAVWIYSCYNTVTTYSSTAIKVSSYAYGIIQSLFNTSHRISFVVQHPITSIEPVEITDDYFV